ncbi:MAG TPA: hypothetical protein VF444_01895 [Pseudonocardiaceae bacterium]
MTVREPEEPPRGPTGLFADELLGLDPNDPETRAFAEHLTRMRGLPTASTVEGYLDGVGQFADSANRLRGHRRLMVTLVVLLLLAVVVGAVLATLGFVWSTLVGTALLGTPF